MTRQLSYGEFHGETKKRNCVSGLVLMETIYPARYSTPRHMHENAYFCYVLKGRFTENYDKKMRDCPVSSLAFHPPAELHAQITGDTDLHLFSVGIESACLKHIQEYSKIFDCQTFLQKGAPAVLAMKLYREFKDMDDVSPLCIEALVLELIASVTRGSTRAIRRKPNTWLKRVEESLHARFAESLSLAEIASEVDVHPVHLGREFRRNFHCTIGQYIRRLRVEYACRALNERDTSISKISLDAGFYDQSHFCRVFRKLTGMTPEGYRSILPPVSRPKDRAHTIQSIC